MGKAAFRVEIKGESELLQKLEQMGANVRAEVKAAALAGAAVIESATSAKARGELGVSAATVQGRAGTVTVSVGPEKDDWYYRFFEFGAAPHMIRPKAGKGRRYLIFQGGQGRVYTRRVHHPGMQARPFLRPGFDEAHGDATDAVGAALKKAIGG